MASARRSLRAQPTLRARAARYDPDTERVMIDLAGGILFGVPLARFREIKHAAASDLRLVEVLAAGNILHWESLDADYSVPALILAAIGPARAAREFARLGGRVRTDAKAAAARANGKKGGRPRKQHR